MVCFQKMWRVSGVALCALWAVVPSVGQADSLGDHPTLTPMRDVVVTYQFQDGQKTTAPMKRVTVSFEASGNRLRIDPADVHGVTILDRLSQKVTLISLDDRSYVQFMPLHGLRNPFLLDLNMTYHAGGKAYVAGYPCRQWSIDTAHGKAEACVTDDGVILSEGGVDADGVTGHLEAVHVSYQDIPESAFMPPAGFHKFQPLAALQRREGQPVPGAGVAHAPSHVPDQGAAETTQPPVSNDSVGDGAVMRDDQPPASSAP